jgi:WD40 repeat protein
LYDLTYASDGIGIEWRDLRNPTEVTQFVPGRTCSTFYWQPESNYFFYSCYFDGNDAGIFSGLSHNKVAMGDRRMPGQLVQTYEEFKSWPSAIEASGNRLLVSDSRKEVNIFDIDSAELLGKLTGHHDWIVDVRADDDVIITAGNDHQLRIWDLETYDCLATHGELAVGTGLCWVQWNEDYLVTCSENPDCGVYVYKYGASLE